MAGSPKTSELREDPFIVPKLLGVEVVSAIRRRTPGLRINAQRSAHFLSELTALPVERYSHVPLLARVWELRHNFTPYGATYIALAEATGADLFTCDEKLRGAHRARVVVFAN